ncbi:hypothetical protein [Catenulispora pinisilvae]|uniref:hypothetical protein n=1 Tax=Catenulispora pinisilvae TaxID=2705253 RepID=UPI001891F680|nr:hypothetical protein [Catenulispora pinisilvae]
MSRSISALGAALLTAAVAAGCGSSGSEPSTQTPGTSSTTSAAPSQPTTGQTCLTPGDDSGITGLPACETQAPQYPPSPTASPTGFQRLTYAHEPGPVPQAPTVTLTRSDGTKVELTLEWAGATSGVQARISIAAQEKQPVVHTVAEGDNVVEAGYTFHIIKIWVMPTPATDAVDLTATPVG